MIGDVFQHAWAFSTGVIQYIQHAEEFFYLLLLDSCLLPCEAPADLSHSLAKESCLKSLIWWGHQRLVLHTFVDTMFPLSRSECWARMRLWDLGPCHGSKALLDSAVHETELDAVEAWALVAPRMDFDLILDLIDQKKPRKQVRTAAIRISRREAAHKSTQRLFPLKLQHIL